MMDQIQRAQADTETVYPTLSELKKNAAGFGMRSWAAKLGERLSGNLIVDLLACTRLLPSG